MNIKISLLCVMTVGAVFASRAEETVDDALADETSTTNFTGVMRVKSPTVPVGAQTFDTILSIPWSDPSADGDDGNVTNLVKVAGLSAGDELYRYDVSKHSYSVWHVVEKDDTENPDTKKKYWEYGRNVSDSVTETTEIPDAEAILGTGLILRVRNHDMTKSYVTNLYVVGSAPTGDTFSVTIPATTEASSLHLLSYPWPTSTAMDVNEMADWASVANTSDQIKMVSTNTASLVTLRFRDGTWTGGKIAAEIPQGMGFWYLRAKDCPSMTIQWKKN